MQNNTDTSHPKGFPTIADLLGTDALAALNQAVAGNLDSGDKTAAILKKAPKKAAIEKTEEPSQDLSESQLLSNLAGYLYAAGVTVRALANIAAKREASNAADTATTIEAADSPQETQPEPEPVPEVEPPAATPAPEPKPDPEPEASQDRLLLSKAIQSGKATLESLKGVLPEDKSPEATSRLLSILREPLRGSNGFEEMFAHHNGPAFYCWFMINVRKTCNSAESGRIAMTARQTWDNRPDLHYTVSGEFKTLMNAAVHAPTYGRWTARDIIKGEEVLAAAQDGASNGNPELIISALKDIPQYALTYAMLKAAPDMPSGSFPILPKLLLKSGLHDQLKESLDLISRTYPRGAMSLLDRIGALPDFKDIDESSQLYGLKKWLEEKRESYMQTGSFGSRDSQPDTTPQQAADTVQPDAVQPDEAQGKPAVPEVSDARLLLSTIIAGGKATPKTLNPILPKEKSQEATLDFLRVMRENMDGKNGFEEMFAHTGDPDFYCWFMIHARHACDPQEFGSISKLAKESWEKRNDNSNVLMGAAVHAVPCGVFNAPTISKGVELVVDVLEGIDAEPPTPGKVFDALKNADPHELRYVMYIPDPQAVQSNHGGNVPFLPGYMLNSGLYPLFKRTMNLLGETDPTLAMTTITSISKSTEMKKRAETSEELRGLMDKWLPDKSKQLQAQSGKQAKQSGR